jgi:hypothetical protein
MEAHEIIFLPQCLLKPPDFSIAPNFDLDPRKVKV